MNSAPAWQRPPDAADRWLNNWSKGMTERDDGREIGMSRKLTAAELAEPDVTIKISPRRWAALPADIRRDIEAYKTTVRDDSQATIISMAAYQFREIEARMKAIEGHAP